MSEYYVRCHVERRHPEEAVKSHYPLPISHTYRNDTDLQNELNDIKTRLKTTENELKNEREYLSKIKMKVTEIRQPFYLLNICKICQTKSRFRQWKIGQLRNVIHAVRKCQYYRRVCLLQSFLSQHLLTQISNGSTITMCELSIKIEKRCHWGRPLHSSVTLEHISLTVQVFPMLILIR